MKFEIHKLKSVRKRKTTLKNTYSVVVSVGSMLDFYIIIFQSCISSRPMHVFIQPHNHGLYCASASPRSLHVAPSSGGSCAQHWACHVNDDDEYCHLLVSP